MYRPSDDNPPDLRRDLPRNRETSLREADTYRATLHRSGLAHVEDASISWEGDWPSGYEARHQIVLPYFGFFKYCVGKQSWLLDPNKTLFISPGWDFRDEHPVDGVGHAALIINPERELLEEVCGRRGPTKCLAFAGVSHPSSMRLRLLTQHMLRLAPEVRNDLHGDEWVAQSLLEAMCGARPQATRNSKVIGRAKEFLHAQACERLSLSEIALAVGVSPVYLTQEFTRSEGIPLYRYQLYLRLNQALLELPHCDDITGLALDLGFSSHSHFSSAFRKTFGITPAEYRQGVGTTELNLVKLVAQAREKCAA